MSAADRMVVRTPAGYRSVPRRVGLGMISAGRAKPNDGGASADAALTPADEPLAAVVPATPESAPTAQEHTQTTAAADELDANDTPTPPNDLDPELEERRRALGLKPGEWMAERGGIKYPTLEPVPSTTDDDVPTVEAVPLPLEPKPTARRGEWADYADSLGVEVTSAMTKREIQQAAREAATSLANLPQPALTGGRLETPEDEPAAETVADDQDPRTR